MRAFEEPRLLGGQKIDVAIPQCRHGRAVCGMSDFFEDNRPLFMAIREAIDEQGDNASDELKTASRLIENAEKNPESLCDDRVCRKLGDVLIAVDGAALDTFAANNDKEWALLAKVLGKDLINPVREAETIE